MEGGSLRSVAQGSARSLLAPQEPTNVALYQVRASATHVQAQGAAVSLGEAEGAHSLLVFHMPFFLLQSEKLRLEEHQ